MTAISQLFMRYKLSESYCVLKGEYHECIRKSPKLKKKQHRKSNTFHAKASAKLIFFI